MKKIVFCFLSLMIFNGCASLLYRKGKVVNETEGIYKQIIPVKSNASYLSAQMEIFRRDSVFACSSDAATNNTDNQLWAALLEITPFGFMAPQFGYLNIIDKKIVGRIAFKLSESVECSNVEGGSLNDDYINFNFPLNDNIGKHIVELVISNVDDFNEQIKRIGKAKKVIPSSIKFNLKYKAGTCSIYADPKIITPDGLIKIKIEEVSDLKRFKEIEEENKKENERKDRIATGRRLWSNKASSAKNLVEHSNLYNVLVKSLKDKYPHEFEENYYEIFIFERDIKQLDDEPYCYTVPVGYKYQSNVGPAGDILTYFKANLKESLVTILDQ